MSKLWASSYFSSYFHQSYGRPLISLLFPSSYFPYFILFPKKSLPLEIETSEQLKRIGLENGLLLYGRRSNKGKFGDNLLIAPPLNVTHSEIDLIIERLAQTISEFESYLERKSYI